jgi:hypothetical protein
MEKLRISVAAIVAEFGCDVAARRLATLPYLPPSCDIGETQSGNEGI